MVIFHFRGDGFSPESEASTNAIVAGHGEFFCVEKMVLIQGFGDVWFDQFFSGGLL